jgi:hypothetical protein
MQKWEYLFIKRLGTGLRSHDTVLYSVNGKRLESEEIWSVANEMGQQGWELISVEQETYSFKRPQS